MTFWALPETVTPLSLCVARVVFDILNEQESIGAVLPRRSGRVICDSVPLVGAPLSCTPPEFAPKDLGVA
jgi:hypothetical protein